MPFEYVCYTWNRLLSLTDIFSVKLLSEIGINYFVGI